MDIEGRRIHLSYSVVTVCMVAQFLVGYDGDHLSYIASGFSATLLLLVTVLVQIKIYSKVKLTTFVKEYWIAMEVASVLSHSFTYAVVILRGDFSLRGDFFLKLSSFLAVGLFQVLVFLVMALLPFLIVVVLLKYVPRSFLSGEST